jgi:hypothetical protein
MVPACAQRGHGINLVTVIVLKAGISIGPITVIAAGVRDFVPILVERNAREDLSRVQVG